MRLKINFLAANPKGQIFIILHLQTMTTHLVNEENTYKDYAYFESITLFAL